MDCNWQIVHINIIAETLKEIEAAKVNPQRHRQLNTHTHTERKQRGNKLKMPILPEMQKVRQTKTKRRLVELVLKHYTPEFTRR